MLGVGSGASAAVAADDELGFPAYWQRPIPAQGTAPGYNMGLALVADLSAADCGICHLPQYQAWQGSWHARALSPGLLGQLDQLAGAEVDACLSCHAPREEARALWWREGLDASAQLPAIDCTSCHVRFHRRFGLNAVELTPHGRVEANPMFADARFCAPCHQFDAEGLSVNGKPLQNTYNEWRASRYADEGVQCQDCHMPEGSHAFAGIHDPAMVRKGLEVQVRRTEDGIRVDAGNRGAAHALPTYITPRILIDLQGERGETRRHEIARRMRWSEDDGWHELADQRLLPDQWVRIELPLAPNETGWVEVSVDPGADYHQRIYPLLLERWADTLGDRARQLLRQAADRAARAVYGLYGFSCPRASDTLQKNCEMVAPSDLGG